MARIVVSAEGVVDAPADTVYRYYADELERLDAYARAKER